MICFNNDQNIIDLVGYDGIDEVNVDPWGGMDPQVKQLKDWKNLRKLGSIRIRPGEVLGPLDEIRAREFDPLHCATLKKKLQNTGSSNSRGVKLVVLNQNLETAWIAASSDLERKNMFTEGHAFYNAVMVEPKYAVGGDHTRSAVTELGKQFPAHEKWQMFKRLTILVCGTSPDAYQQCKDLGVMYNSKQFHKEMGFADRMLLTHKYYAQQGQLEKGTRRTTEVTAWCDKQCALADIPKNSWSQYAASARLDGQAWFYMEAILKGKYGTAIKKGVLPGNVPTTQSPMIKILTCPADVIEDALKKVYQGEISIAMLSNMAENYKAYALAREMIIWAVQSATTQGFNEDSIARAYPLLMSKAFILDFVLGVKNMMKNRTANSASDCPGWIKAKVVEHLRFKEQVLTTTCI